MRPSKHSENEWEPPAVLSNEEEAAARRRLRLIFSRAAGAYLLLFLGLGLVMSAMGVSPLANDGLMPKVLLVFVALAVLLAVANSLTDLLREQGRNWLRLFPRRRNPSRPKQTK